MEEHDDIIKLSLAAKQLEHSVKVAEDQLADRKAQLAEVRKQLSLAILRAADAIKGVKPVEVEAVGVAKAQGTSSAKFFGRALHDKASSPPVPSVQPGETKPVTIQEALGLPPGALDPLTEVARDYFAGLMKENADSTKQELVRRGYTAVTGTEVKPTGGTAPASWAWATENDPISQKVSAIFNANPFAIISVPDLVHHLGDQNEGAIRQAIKRLAEKTEIINVGRGAYQRNMTQPPTKKG